MKQLSSYSAHSNSSRTHALSSSTHSYAPYITMLVVCLTMSINSLWGATIVSRVINDYATANSWSNGTKYASIPFDTNISATAVGGANDGKYYSASPGTWRFYQKSSGGIKISAESGYKLWAVAFTFSIADGGTLLYGGNALTSKVPCYVTGNEVTFSVGHNNDGTEGKVLISEIRVWYTTINATLNFTRISSASDLSDGDEIIFVHPGEAYACSTTQNTDNRPSTAISTSDHKYVYSLSDNVQVFYVRKDGDNYGFNTLAGYIYSGAGDANKLKTDDVIATTDPSGTNAWTLEDVSSYQFEFKNATNTGYHLAFYSTSTFNQYPGNNLPYIYKREMGQPDHFIDIMHGNEVDDIYGTYSMPSIDDEDKGSTYEEEKHYKFIGWVAEGGIDEHGTPTGTVIIPGTEMTGNNTTYYAVWATDVE